ncbi:PAS domain S-box protein [Pelolinea submarina]|uniref:histidine kinase n=1 Tax=Pelolinea submarina TaxID=913107 RepID=A0A347ZP81_9CHLR|nr:PAS domain S-box protein [Pelolinea submarina]REG08713.1 PAS domain S-box-containing protein [Pelolinea submarina]BBB47112.1 two-component system sensor histidine kinase [Pelolinea submarina]
MNFIEFIDNAALLLVLSILSNNIQLRWLKREPLQSMALGLLYGLVAVTAMSIPMELQPGVIFDGRSVVLSLAGLFTSGPTTLIACVIAALWRVYLGGAGLFTGIGSIIISGMAGIIYRRAISRKVTHLTRGRLFLFGLSVHAILAMWFFTFPREIAILIVRQVFVPYLVVFPLATMLIGSFMEEQRERLQVEKDLENSEKRYRDLVSTLNEGVWEADADLVTTYVNPKIVEMLGYTPQEMLGHSVYDFIVPDEADNVRSHHLRRKQGISEQYETQFIRKDGSLIDVQLGVTPLVDEKGNFRGSLAGIQDISNLKAIQQELADQSRHLEDLVEERTRDLKDAQSQLIRAEKLATLGELAGGVGHELRNPLAVISNVVYLLKSSLPKSDANLLEYVEMIETETHNASSIINDLLNYSRIQPTEKEPAALSEVMAALLAKLPVPKNVTVENMLPADLPKATVNGQQVEMIFTNLISNAIEAMPKGGKLNISARVRGDNLTVSVTDTGVGISRKDLKKIFEPLYTTKPRGIGLGLAITSRLAELNNIKIRVKSQEGHGTTFSLDFLITA